MVRDLRVQAREIGDQETLLREEQKRNEWQFENSLRRHNFVGFAGEVLKGVIGEKLKEGPDAYGKWVEEGKAKTKARSEEQKGKKGTVDEDAEMAG